MPTLVGVPLPAYAITVLGTLLFTSINYWTARHNFAELVEAGEGWRILCWEASSALVILLLLPLIGQAVIAAGTPAKGRRLPFTAIHAAAFLLFFAIHISGFVLLRTLVYGLAGEQYRFGGIDALLYEAPKDLAVYIIITMVMAVACFRWSRPPEQAPDSSPESRTYVVREGTRTYRVPFDDIIAVSAAGNYAELHLADRRRPLIRTTLSLVERELLDRGFVRTHRSWIVNIRHIQGIEPAASGDRRLFMAGDLAVPLSRRYPAALAQVQAHLGLADRSVMSIRQDHAKS